MQQYYSQHKHHSDEDRDSLSRSPVKFYHYLFHIPKPTLFPMHIMMLVYITT